MPLVSVLLPVRNAAPWLPASLASLWRQTLGDFEVIAVDDGSTDGSGELLERAAARERRLVVLHARPRGLPATLNAALQRSRAPFVARHDADDVSHRRRFEIQHARLRRQPEIAVIGSRVRMFPSPAVGRGMQRWAAWHNSLLDHASMAREVLIDSPLAHGATMMRRPILECAGGWRERGWPEDVDLWVRLIEQGARLAKCPEVLYGWRQHRTSATRLDPRYSRERFDALRIDVLERRFLRHAHRVTAVGIGAALERWRLQLERRGRAVTVLRQGRPRPDALAALAPPALLVFGSPVARGRWRAAVAPRLEETRDFWFVA